MKNPFSEKGESGSAIALSFDQFQLRHVSFDHSVADPPGETCSHGIFVFFHRSLKRLEFGQFAALHLGKPSIKALSLTLT